MSLLDHKYRMLRNRRLLYNFICITLYVHLDEREREKERQRERERERREQEREIIDCHIY